MKCESISKATYAESWNVHSSLSWNCVKCLTQKLLVRRLPEMTVILCSHFGLVSSPILPNLLSFLQPTIGDKMSWDTFPKTGLFDVLLTSKGGNIAFLPIPSVQCCALVLAAYRKQQRPQLWMEGTGEGCGFFCSPKLPYLRTMSQQFCCRLSESQKWPYVL